MSEGRQGERSLNATSDEHLAGEFEIHATDKA